LKNTRVNITNFTQLNESLHVTLLVNYKGLFWDVLHDEMNNQFTFLQFLIIAIENNFLTSGSILIADNATVHCASDTIEVIYSILSAAGIKLLFLPKYSPELNPCELVFSFVKCRVYTHGLQTNSIFSNVESSFNKVTKKMIINYFKKCFLIK
jgi:transposase